jgi:hypothetical protein
VVVGDRREMGWYVVVVGSEGRDKTWLARLVIVTSNLTRKVRRR